MKLSPNTFATFFSFFILLITATSCYRMPSEGEYSVVPVTNNPAVVGNCGSQGLVPGAGF